MGPNKKLMPTLDEQLGDGVWKLLFTWRCLYFNEVIVGIWIQSELINNWVLVFQLNLRIEWVVTLECKKILVRSRTNKITSPTFTLLPPAKTEHHSISENMSRWPANGGVFKSHRRLSEWKYGQGYEPALLYRSPLSAIAER